MYIKSFQKKTKKTDGRSQQQCATYISKLKKAEKVNSTNGRGSYLEPMIFCFHQKTDK